MDVNSQSVIEESFRSPALGRINDILVIDNSLLPAQPPTCSLCQRIFSSDNELGDLESVNICGDCKFLILEDVETPTREFYQRRTPGSRRRRRESSESIESPFSQQFSQIINLARQTRTLTLDHDNHSDGDVATARSVQQTSSRTTPSGSRRWRRVLSDAESDGFDSLYGETESNFSFRRYRTSHREGDTMSYSAYGGDSDVSVDGQSLLENENFANLDGGSGLDSDTDIDPMHAGFYQWNSDDQEEEDEDDGNSEWEEVEDEEIAETSRSGAQLQRSLRSIGRNVRVNWRRQLFSPEFEGTIRLRFQERIQAYSTNTTGNLEEAEAQNQVENSGDYLDARGFENLLDHLFETDGSRRGAPPAAISFINNMPRLVIDEHHENLNGSECAICKDSFTIGTVVNQLPCLHLYHPSCILPWLSTRNSCPLCRYELPTDDNEYEDRKRSSGSGYTIQQHDMTEDSSSDYTDDDDEVDEVPQFGQSRAEQIEPVNVDSVAENSARENSGRRWLFLVAAAAPIVSMVGFTLMLWLGKPSTDRRLPSGRVPYHRDSSRSRRWWSFF